MADQTPRREIKLNITQPDARVAPKPQYVYRWDRIFGAAAALVLLLALIGYGLYAWLRPSSPPVSVEAEGAPAQETATVETARQAEDAVQGSVPSQSASAPEIAAEDTETGADSSAIPAASPAIESDPGRSQIPAEPTSEGLSQQVLSEPLEVDPLRVAEAGSPLPEIAEPVPVQIPAEKSTESATASEEIAAPEAGQIQASTDEEIAEPEPGPIGTAEEMAEPETTPTRAAAEAVEPEAGQASTEQKVAEPKSGQTSGSEADVQDLVRSSAKTPPGETGSESSAVSVAIAPVEPGQAPVPEPESDIDTDTDTDIHTHTHTHTEAEQADSPAEEAREGLFRSPKVSISSEAVKRFVLAQSVSGKAPQGRLADITMSSKGYAPVSVFSEVTDLQGEVLEYHWLHDGKRVLRIRVPVGGKRWRSHTTKNIYKRMKGAWRIELRDSAGQLLASGDFVF